MNFEKYYAKLPNFIKYNNFVYHLSLKASKKLRNLNKQNNQLESQNQLFNLLFTNCNIEITGTLKDIRLLYVELLKFIDNVCRKHDIKYWIDYGALLGAVRHGGFIPWDDDIDISIMRNDYNKLIEILPEEIIKYPELMDNCGLTLLVEGHNNYFKEFTSVYDVEDKNNILGDLRFSFLQIAIMKPYLKIDIFPKDYIIETELEKYSKNYEIEKYKFNNDIKNSTNDFFKEIEYRKTKVGQVNEKTKYCANSLEHIILEKPIIYEVDDIFPLSTIKFEENYFNCPNNVHKNLKIRYGENYMGIPPVIEHHNLINFIKSQFTSEDEMNNQFEEIMAILKNINDNFD